MTKWKLFEKLVAKIQSELSPDAIVKHDDYIRDRVTGAMRQVDVTIKKKIGQFEFLCAMECRDQKRPVDVIPVEAFIQKVQDIGASKGVIVSSSGFTENAIAKSKQAQIDAYCLLDLNDFDWNSIFKIPFVVDIRALDKFGVKFIYNGIPIRPKVPLETVLLYDSTSKPIGTALELSLSAWNNKMIPDEPGLHVNIPLTNQEIYIDNDGIYIKVEAKIMANIVKQLYWGELNVSEVEGFHNISNDELLPSKLTSEALDLWNVENHYSKIDAISQLAVQPMMVVMLRKSGSLTEAEPEDVAPKDNTNF